MAARTSWTCSSTVSTAASSRLAENSGRSQPIDLTGPEPKVGKDLNRVLAERRRGKIGICAVAIEANRRSHERYSGHRSDHAPMLCLHVGKGLADGVDWSGGDPRSFEQSEPFVGRLLPDAFAH